MHPCKPAPQPETPVRHHHDPHTNAQNVDVVYIGTPHTFHHANAKAAILAGKNVLCEKPFTFDLAELDELIELAREKDVFLMEAVWTRFHPIAYAVQDVLKSGKLGKVKRMFADFSMNFEPDSESGCRWAWVGERVCVFEGGGGGVKEWRHSGLIAR